MKTKISEIKISIFKTNECYFYVLFVLFTILNQRPLKYIEYRYFNFHIKLLQGITHINNMDNFRRKIKIII